MQVFADLVLREYPRSLEDVDLRKKAIKKHKVVSSNDDEPDVFWPTSKETFSLVRNCCHGRWHAIMAGKWLILARTWNVLISLADRTWGTILQIDKTKLTELVAAFV